MTLVSRLMPPLAIVVAVFVCALPWGLPPEFRLVMPLLPYVIIHRCVERRGDVTPDWLVFLAGFATDVVGQGPLGYWCLIYLSGYTMIRSVTVDREHGVPASLFLFGVTLTTLSMMQWSAASIYYLRSIEVAPLLVSAAVALAAYLAVLLLFPARVPAPVRTNTRLERGQ